MEIRKTFQAVFITIIFILASFQAAYAIGEGFTYDANGNMIQGPDGLYYEYNDANQLKRVREGGPTGEIIAEYWYDHEGKRLMKNESGVVTYYWFEDFEQIYYPNGTIVNITYYSANGERLAKKVSTAAGDKMYYFHPDHLGSTSVVSDEAGNLVEKTEYYPYGGVKQGGSEQYLFTGKELDKATGLYDYGARQYHPDLARFVQPDSIVPDPYDPQQLNRYTYARDNPLKYKDSTGHYLETPIDIVSISLSIHDVRQDPANKWNWIALAADVATLALPGAAGGGLIVKGLTKGDDVVDAAKVASKIPSNPYKAKHGGRNMDKHISKQQEVGDTLRGRLIKEGHDPDNIEIRYGTQAYDLKTSKRVKGTRADIQAFDKTTGKPLSRPYEIEPNTLKGQKNFQTKDSKYEKTDYERVEYEK